MGVWRRRWLEGSVVLLAVLVSGCRKPEWTLTADTGFFERRDALVAASVDFGPSVRITGLRSLPGGGAAGESVPFWYVPGSGSAGTLYWVMAGEVPSLEQRRYTVSTTESEPQTVPYGEVDLSERISRETNLLPNPGFEEDAQETPSKRSTWNGVRLPAGWSLNDYAWRYRELPELRSRCRLSEEHIHSGSRSLALSSELRDVADDKGETKPTRVSGFATGPTVPLRPGGKYYLRYYARIMDLSPDEEQHLSVSASVNFLDAEKKRIYPRQYAINRIQAAYTVNRHLPEEYADKWVCVSFIKETPPGVCYGQLTVGISLVGTVYVDDFVLKEFHPGDPVSVTIEGR